MYQIKIFQLQTGIGITIQRWRRGYNKVRGEGEEKGPLSLDRPAHVFMHTYLIYHLPRIFSRIKKREKCADVNAAAL